MSKFVNVWLCLVAILLSLAAGKRITRSDYSPDIVISDSIPEDSDVSNENLDKRRQLATENLPDAEDHRVVSLPGLTKDDSVNHYAGHLPADPLRGGNFFYWLFESKKDAEKKPLIIWLNGGPGCSSMDGLWLELGPFRIVDGGRAVKWNKYSWHEVGNLLFVDQPVGTGLSFTSSKDGLAKNDKMVNEHFYTFLQNFFTVHKRYVNGKTGDSGKKRTRPIVFTGESHAGHYIPSLVKYILERNQAGDQEFEILVKGIALGNPWIDPPNQYNPADFAHGLGIISSGQVNKMKEQESQCRRLLQEGKLNNKVCMNLLDDIIETSSVGNGAKVIMYDTRQYSVNSNVFPPGHDAVEVYLNRADVRKAIHATRTPQLYVECSDPPYYALSHQDGKGVTEELAYLLDAGLPLLIYLGQYDLICNHLSIEKVLDSLVWNGRNEWLSSQPSVWMQGNRPAGYSRKYKNLQSLLVLNAGHMVPMDQPEIALSMIRTFVDGTDFGSGKSKVGVTISPNALCAEGARDGTAIQQKSQYRSLLQSTRVNHDVHFYPVLIHATPLQKEVFLRIRMQSLSPASHVSATSSIASSHMMQHAWEFLASSSFYLLIEPSDQVIRFSENRTWMSTMNGHRHHHHVQGNTSSNVQANKLNTASLGTGSSNMHNNQQHHLDIVITGLEYGVVYTFSMHHDYDPASLKTPLPASSARSIHTKVGCFTPGFEQCCGRGDCVVSKSSAKASAPQCHCDPGYSGAHCDHYAIAGIGADLVSAGASSSSSPSATKEVHDQHINPHSPRRQLQFENVSASESMCPRRVLPSSAAIHVSLSSLKHRSAVASNSAMASSTSISVPSQGPSSTVSAISTTSAAKCGSTDSADQSSSCCRHVSMRVLHKKFATDSNTHMHSSDYRTVQRQRLEQGLAELLQGFSDSSASKFTVQITQLGTDEGGRRGQNLVASICGNIDELSTALQSFSALVDSDKAEINKAHDTYAIQGPVVTLTSASPSRISPTNKETSSLSISTIPKSFNRTANVKSLREEHSAQNEQSDPSSQPAEIQQSTWSSWSFINIFFVLIAVISLSIGLAWTVRQRPPTRLYNAH